MVKIEKESGGSKQMNLIDWFDVYSVEHLKAYRHLEQKGVWPEGFIPSNIEVSGRWQIALCAKMADAYLMGKEKTDNNFNMYYEHPQFYEELMVLAAFRYCLGRQSYIVSVCIKWLKVWWQSFEVNTKRVIIADTLIALQDNAAGSKYDFEDWKQFCIWAIDNMKEEEDKIWCLHCVEYRNKPWPLL
jgi:hypothetical protein